jgi:cardiolipin synthase
MGGPIRHVVPSLTDEETRLRPDRFSDRGVKIASLNPPMKELAREHLNRYRTMPNLLTLLRICLAPFLVAAILGNHFALSFGLFVAAGLTDALDGLLARLLKQRSQLGEYLDPVADKLLLSTLFLVLMHMSLVPVTVTVLVFGRDVGILLVAAILYAAAGRREFSPSIFGKANTLAQVSAVAAVLLEQAILQHVPTHQLSALHWVVVFRMVALDATIGLTVASGLHYSWVAARRTGAQSLNNHASK